MKGSSFSQKNNSIDNRKGLFIKTFGCQMNEYDSAKIRKLLEESYRPVATPTEASLIIVNTCSVREKPAHKLYSFLGELKPLKEGKEDLLIGVGGCVAQQEGQEIARRSSLVDFVFGTHNLSLLPALIARRLEGAPPQIAIDYRDGWEDLPLGFVETGKVSVFISISRGCNKHCSYCIVPFTRGPEVSRNPAEIEHEAQLAICHGAKELVLLGQNVNSYGHDLSPRLNFEELLARISALDGLERIRFTSPHPQEVNQNFIDTIAVNSKVCRHIHLPMQSGSNAVLKAMRRNYRREKYISIVEALRARLPDISFTTDIIVGFPGETEEDFQQTMEMMERVQFDSSFSFMYSPRPGTHALTLKNQLPEAEKLRRLQMLQRRQEEISALRLRKWIGAEEEILLEGPSPTHKEFLQGRLSQNIMVNLNKAYQGIAPGMIIRVRITDAGRHTLKGDYLASE